MLRQHGKQDVSAVSAARLATVIAHFSQNRACPCTWHQCECETFTLVPRDAYTSQFAAAAAAAATAAHSEAVLYSN